MRGAIHFRLSYERLCEELECWLVEFMIKKTMSNNCIFTGKRNLNCINKIDCKWCYSCHDFIISSSVPFAAATSIFISKRWTFLSVTERLLLIVIGKKCY